MSRTKHARRHAHKWKLSSKFTYYCGGDRFTRIVYHCAHPGCFAAKVVRS